MEYAMLVSTAWLLQSQAAVAKACRHWQKKPGWIESQGGNERRQELKRSIIAKNLKMLSDYTSQSTITREGS